MWGRGSSKLTTRDERNTLGVPHGVYNRIKSNFLKGNKLAHTKYVLFPCCVYFFRNSSLQILLLLIHIYINKCSWENEIRSPLLFFFIQDRLFQLILYDSTRLVLWLLFCICLHCPSNKTWNSPTGLVLLLRLWTSALPSMCFSPKNLLSAMIAASCHDSKPWNSLTVAFMVSAAGAAINSGGKHHLQEHR